MIVASTELRGLRSDDDRRRGRHAVSRRSGITVNSEDSEATHGSEYHGGEDEEGLVASNKPGEKLIRTWMIFHRADETISASSREARATCYLALISSL